MCAKRNVCICNVLGQLGRFHTTVCRQEATSSATSSPHQVGYWNNYDYDKQSSIIGAKQHIYISFLCSLLNINFPSIYIFAGIPFPSWLDLYTYTYHKKRLTLLYKLRTQKVGWAWWSRGRGGRRRWSTSRTSSSTSSPSPETRQWLVSLPDSSSNPAFPYD